MALTEPAGLPAWNTEQAREPRPIHAPVPMARGDVRVRRTLRAGPSVVTLRRHLTAAEMGTWWTWWRQVARDGALAFDATLARLGSGVETVAVSLLAPPTLTPIGGGGVWIMEAQAITGVLFDGPGDGPNPGVLPPPVARDEWRLVGGSPGIGLGTPFGPFGTAPYAQRIWDADTAGTLQPQTFNTFLFLRRHTVVRVDPPATRTIVSDVVSTDPTPPTTTWTPAGADPSPELVPWDLSQGIWRMQRAFGQPIAFAPDGVFTIGGPGAALRTVISRPPGAFYRPIAWEYLWQA